MSETQKPLEEFIHDRLREGSWIGLGYEDDKKLITCPKGEVLSYSKRRYTLKFFSFNPRDRTFSERSKYKEISFPADLDFKKYLYFRRSNGNYKLSYETQFKKIINPFDNEVEAIKVTSGKGVRRFNGKTLTISKDIFVGAMKDAKKVADKKFSYAASVETYLASLEAAKYERRQKQKTTCIKEGELAFTVARLNLGNKKKKADFEKHLNQSDIASVEELVDRMVRYDVFSAEFLRRLDDYFIKEKLQHIIALGKKILALKKDDLSSPAAKEIMTALNAGMVRQLETLWQKYFQDNLLYLIFSYKKIFPKIELTGLDAGEKKYPDFIGINHYNGLDVIEIKTHLTKVLSWDKGRKNFFFSSEMSRAIVQTTNYLDSITRERFKESSDKAKITNYTEEENLYHPKGVIIISSTKHLTSKTGEDKRLKRDFTKLRNGLKNIEILTFDEVLGIADEYIKNILEN